MEKINNLEDLRIYLKDNINSDFLFIKEDDNASAFDNFQNGFESGYSNSYANLLCLLDPEFKTQFDSKNANNN